MTNREMAIRFAYETIRRMLKYDPTQAENALKVLEAEIEVFDFINELQKNAA